MYVDYWHFDEGEIADWASLWNTMPWEIYSAIEQAVIDGKVSISRSGVGSKNISWVSLIIPNDALVIQSYLDEFEKEKFVPAPLKQLESDLQYYEKRYSASSEWITKNNHAVISNGPFYLNAYSPESRTISVSAFEDKSYPFKVGYWSAQLLSQLLPSLDKNHVSIAHRCRKSSDPEYPENKGSPLH